VTDNVRKPPRKKDSLLAHCLLRATLASQPADVEHLSKWAALRAVAKVTPMASRVAAFVVMWAVAMREEGLDSYSITKYQRYWKENERQAYRLQEDFRELWPEYETPNELACQLLDQIDGRISKREVVSLPVHLQVVA
jgi:hypothetical protein